MPLALEQREMVSRSAELHEFEDKDGIVSVPAVTGEAAADRRLMDILVASYGEEWSNDTLFELLRASKCEDKSLENWLRDEFFKVHCEMFKYRPFIWQVWDGLPDGFSALINCHKLDYKLMETLIYAYLGDWISRQRYTIKQGDDGGVERLAAAESLQKRLEAILHGEAPYDIFVRWKPLPEQPLGWNPDLNDGVRVNIRPFATGPDIGRKGSGILRDKPGIKWDKDRGKESESSPWYHLDKGERINDRHLTLG
jgi:hypothetical protein